MTKNLSLFQNNSTVDGKLYICNCSVDQAGGPMKKNIKGLKMTFLGGAKVQN